MEVTVVVIGTLFLGALLAVAGRPDLGAASVLLGLLPLLMLLMGVKDGKSVISASFICSKGDVFVEVSHPSVADGKYLVDSGLLSGRTLYPFESCKTDNVAALVRAGLQYKRLPDGSAVLVAKSEKRK